jgi:hypothetical protein
MSFGDIDVTLLVDTVPQSLGCETVTAAAVQRIIDQPGPGTCHVRLQRLGVDTEPKTVHTVGPEHFAVIGSPMQWLGFWDRLPDTPRHVVVVVVHQLCPWVRLRRPQTRTAIPLVVAVNVNPELVAHATFAPPTHIMHIPTSRLSVAWDQVYHSIERARCVVNGRMAMTRAMFPAEYAYAHQRPSDAAAFARHIGEPLRPRLHSQREAAARHIV